MLIIMRQITVDGFRTGASKEKIRGLNRFKNGWPWPKWRGAPWTACLPSTWELGGSPFKWHSGFSPLRVTRSAPAEWLSHDCETEVDANTGRRLYATLAATAVAGDGRLEQPPTAEYWSSSGSDNIPTKGFSKSQQGYSEMFNWASPMFQLFCVLISAGWLLTVR